MTESPASGPAPFPPAFVWGAATSSYQIEGATRTDGRGRCVWDMLSARPRRIWNSDTADVACDHYHRWSEDVALMRRLGLRAYRFSLSWPRLLPAGTGALNETGFAFYDRLIDALLEAGIEPWVTLFHWDYPHALYCRGGWLNPESPGWFADYTRHVVDRFSDRVSCWITLNEPQCFIGLGLHTGEHAPGDRLGLAEVLQAAHHVLLAQGHATRIIRDRARRPPTVGWSHTGDIPYPVTLESLAAARQAWQAVPPDSVWSHTWWNDPLFLGHYPEEGLRAYGDSAPRFTTEDLRLIHSRPDFFGTNNYRAFPVTTDATGAVVRLPPPPGIPLSHMDWPVEPDLLYWAARWPWERYQRPIIITENGFAGLDWVGVDGTVPDGARCDYLARNLAGLARAHAEGIPLGGYFHWSLMDNFEWNHGYRYRFGLIHVDFPTGRRTPKASFDAYRQIIATHGRHLPVAR